MSHHNDHGHGHNEPKPVSFTVPLILGAVTVLIILLFVSLGDPGHCECADSKACSEECMKACEGGDHSGHPAEMKHEEGHGEHNEAAHEEHAATTTDSIAAPADTTHHAAEPAKEEAHH